MNLIKFYSTRCRNSTNGQMDLLETSGTV